MKSSTNVSRDVNNRALFNKKDKVCPLAKMPDSEIDYKNPNFLRKYVSERGRMLPRRITSISAKKQRMLKNAIKRARVLALLPYSAKD